MGTDVLSELLSAVRLTGSVFFDVTATSPWVAEAPPSAKIADAVTPGAQHAIEYHVVTQGACWISLVDGEAFEPVRLEEGDIAVMPQGDAHAVSSAPGMRAEPIMEAHRRPADDNALPFKMITGSGGPSDAHLVSGFFSCDVRPFNPLVESLPRFMRLGRGASTASDGLLDSFIRFAAAEANNKRAGSQSVLNRLSELMFVEVIRMHMDQLAENNTGWLADQRIAQAGALALGAGRALRASHRLSADPVSDAMAYAARRQAIDRQQRQGRRRRRGGRQNSEAAFSRAFKKATGSSPSEWRANSTLLRGAER